MPAACRLFLTVSSLFCAASWLTSTADATDAAAAAAAQFLARGHVNGCPFSVLDLGRGRDSADERLLMEPLMCVTTSPDELAPRFDPVLRRSYLSVPVLLSDSELLAHASRQVNRPDLGTLSSARITEVNTVEDGLPTSVIVALDFVWTPPQPVGFLWLGCRREVGCNEILRSHQLEAIEGVLLSAKLLGLSSNSSTTFTYRLMVQNQTLSMSNGGSRDVARPPTCPQLRPLKTLESENCAIQVYQRLDRRGHYLVEPLLCYDKTIAKTVLRKDKLRGTNYLRLTLMLQDDFVLNTVKTHLEYLRPISVEFMRLWQAKAVVDSEFSNRYQIGTLLISENSSLAKVQVHCSNWSDCAALRCAITTDPIYFWRHVKWTYETTVDDTCLHTPATGPRHSWQVLREAKPISARSRRQLQCNGTPCKYVKYRGGKEYTVVLQRIRGSVSFQRNWTEYENGFGDETDFWIGLEAVHALSKFGITLRIELKLFNGTELFGEFNEFRVGNSSTNYRMTYSEMATTAGFSNMGFDPLIKHQGMQFSTLDRDNDANEYSCSNNWGRGGWWFSSCYDFYPTGLFPLSKTSNYSYMIFGDVQRLAFRQVRLMFEADFCG
ncbi:hypothetical protein BOX15_Mlig010465g1 [Macrostomum lignano]|uniref:Fibrinogen C-terminal domain-containing protein n=1 Tax=Macrostomum lignano TaxID=282301 RepID=A0A267GRJ3_9PLAT|nr:hypothetical protein BOX15_Mlig010465g1 [Macrostomum lignano]